MRPLLTLPTRRLPISTTTTATRSSTTSSSTLLRQRRAPTPSRPGTAPATETTAAAPLAGPAGVEDWRFVDARGVLLVVVVGGGGGGGGGSLLLLLL